MSKYNETILTAAGLDLSTRSANGKTKFTITKAKTTADDLSKLTETELQDLEDLPNVVQVGKIINQKDNIPNSKSVVGTDVLITNERIEESYSINAVGIYAQEDGSDKEILYAVTTAIEPEFIPDYSDQVLLEFQMTIYVIVGRTENVTVSVDPNGTASKDYVDTKLNELNTNDVLDEPLKSEIDDMLTKIPVVEEETVNE